MKKINLKTLVLIIAVVAVIMSCFMIFAFADNNAADDAMVEINADETLNAAFIKKFIITSHLKTRAVNFVWRNHNFAQRGRSIKYLKRKFFNYFFKGNCVFWVHNLPPYSLFKIIILYFLLKGKTFCKKLTFFLIIMFFGCIINKIIFLKGWKNYETRYGRFAKCRQINTL